VRARLSLAGQRDLGVRAIAVAAVVGTDGRCCDFDRCFHPLRDGAQVAHAFPPTAPTHCRSREGRQRVLRHLRASPRRSGPSAGTELIDAHVVEIGTRYELEPTAGVDDVALLESEHRFLRATGPEQARPGVRIRCATAAGYGHLLESVKSHAYDLCLVRADVVEPAEAAAHWHDCLFVPVVEAARGTGLHELLAAAGDGDLFLSLYTAERATFGGGVAHVRDGALRGRGGAARQRAPAPPLVARTRRERPPILPLTADRRKPRGQVLQYDKSTQTSSRQSVRAGRAHSRRPKARQAAASARCSQRLTVA
jgi:hypothetical protein